jgi:regulator of RNase E activity RraA
MANKYEFPLRKLEVNYDVDEIAARYKKLYTPLVYDVLEQEYNLTGRALAPGLYPLAPHMKVAGPAFTVQGVAAPDDIVPEEKNYWHWVW